MSSDIASLTERMRQGDEAAYREFYEGYFDRLFRYLLVVAAGREDAAREALQTTLLRVVRYIKRFESEEAFWSWLTVLAKSAAIDEQRKQTRYRSLLDRFFRRHQPAPPAAEDSDRRLVALLESGLAGLDSEERQLLDWKYFEGESVSAIAAALNTTEKAVESRLVRARRRLKQTLLKGLEE